MRPSYFTFELLARVTGERLEANSSDDTVHAFLSFDNSYKTYNLMFWNFSNMPITVSLDARDLTQILVAKRRMLDAESPSEDENARLRPLPDLKVIPGAPPIELLMGPYAIQSWAMEPPDWQLQLVGR